MVSTSSLNGELKKVHPSLIFELAPPDKDGKRGLVVSADGDRKAFPAVKRLSGAAPALGGWRVIAFRPRHDDLANLALEVAGVTLDPKVVQYSSETSGGRLGLHLHLPGYKDGATELQMATMLLLDAVLGEYDVEAEIGFIELHPLGETTTDLKPLTALRTEVDLWKRSRGDAPESQRELD